ncbi:ABC transporter substrate-binding protein [Moritella sp. JT01]|uniref:ABC transporter substrate-binding protein n=1 Tax=Moritella sp. JT01 TaxID=756698 RepID=UPI001D171B1C|nr:ABC transporter substrate binding protein [Moritella sp. JT01]
MENSLLSGCHIGIPSVVFLTFLLSLLSPASQASQLRVTLSVSDSGMVVEHVQSGLQSELTRQGYVVGTNLTWMDESQAQLSDVNMTISMSQSTPFITLVSQQGVSTDIYLDKSSMDENHHDELIDHYDVNFIKKLLPGINTLGVIIDNNSTDTFNVSQFLAQQKQNGVQVIYSYIDRSAELRTSARVLAQQVDAIYLPHHITDMPDLNYVVIVAERNDVALIGEDHSSINKGVFAVYNIDYVQIGRDTADLLVRLAEGEQNLHTDNYLVQPVLSINLDAAARMGIELSGEVIDKAKYIIE